MSASRYRPHVMVLPEDDANRQLATGFRLDLSQALSRQFQVLQVAGGWRNVLEQFRSIHAREMDACPTRFMVFLIDFDGILTRLDEAKNVIPAHLIERVFILGVKTRPEDFPANLGSLETIGKALARDCREETDTTWKHDLLRHNATELDRLRAVVRPILFNPN